MNAKTRLREVVRFITPPNKLEATRVPFGEDGARSQTRSLESNAVERLGKRPSQLLEAAGARPS
jgi:hypothetical protein